jgi:hypothetical protein
MNPPFFISAHRLGMFQLRLNLLSSCCLSLIGRYFVLTAVWLVIATFALVIIHRSSAHVASSDSTISMSSDSISDNSAHTLEASLIPESKHTAFSFTTRCFDQMHQYSVVVIILSSGFWQYFVQGLMSQLALGPILSSQYQINLFWIQQCHLTIGASYSSPFSSFVDAATGSLLGRGMCYLSPVVSCLQRRWVSCLNLSLHHLILKPDCR